MIPVYNCSHLLAEALKSVLVQDPGEGLMQIEVIDDASTDADVAGLVAAIGEGRVSYFRQAGNVGSLRNFETCINRAKGELVHLLHGDDRVKPGYYDQINRLFTRWPQIGAAFCRYDFIDEKGTFLWGTDSEADREIILDNWLLRIAGKQRLQYCTIAVKREVYETLGGFYGVTYGEDWEMWVRIASHYAVAYTPEVLAEYRMHDNSISYRSFSSAQNFTDIKWVIDRIGEMIPEKERAPVKKAASKHYAHYALTIANSLWHKTKNKRTTHRQITEALAMHTDITMLPAIAKIYIKMLINRG